MAEPVLLFKNVAGQTVRMRACDLSGVFPAVKDGATVWEVHCRMFGKVAIVDEEEGNRLMNRIINGFVEANEARHGG